MSAVPIVDVFAGPGGLNEGFSSLVDHDGNSLFKSVSSFEMDIHAINTLKLRAALRFIRRDSGRNPEVYYQFLRRGETAIDWLKSHDEMKVAFESAEAEVQQVEMGPNTREITDAFLAKALESYGDTPWVLVGGPPCQAYSLAGRSRRTNDPNFVDDHKHVLYREYLHILRKHRPALFVMENVKGMLSSQHDGGSIFQKILADLSSPAEGVEYDLRSFVVKGGDPRPQDYVLRAEDFGIPQRRHRVIILGVLRGAGFGDHVLLSGGNGRSTVAEALDGVPPIRAMVSPRGSDSEELFGKYRQAALKLAGHADFGDVHPLGSSFVEQRENIVAQTGLAKWLFDPKLGGYPQHESRAHMPSDLQRYAYLAALAVHDKTLKVNELPESLIPNHRNARRSDAPFADRFRVQRLSRPSSTVVSHISKDGHYYIHPDPMQMRSLSVREAARLQTFPDDYFFTGNRTQQYHQVGNAVPPLLARQIGESVARLLGLSIGAGRL